VKYEYKVIEIRSDGTAESLEAQLTHCGEMGYRVVNSHPLDDGRFYAAGLIIMEKVIEDEGETDPYQQTIAARLHAVR
jgi:hypothetical protein